MLLELKGIYKNYIQGKMDVPVLKNINLTIEKGEYVAIMGPSGSGKSTLMNIIGALDQPTSGEYYFDGEEISGFSDKKLSELRNKKIGFVFQNFNLLPRQSALQNVELPLQYAKVPMSKRRGLCEEALKKVGLEERMTFKPTQLSGGQKQRVAIARAMVNSPSILLADEPTGALDSKSGIQVMELFRELHNDGATIIMITHAREIAEYADRIITIFDGEIKSDEKNMSVRVTPVIHEETDTVNAADGSAEVSESVNAADGSAVVAESVNTADGNAEVSESVNAAGGNVEVSESVNTADGSAVVAESVNIAVENTDDREVTKL